MCTSEVVFKLGDTSCFKFSTSIHGCNWTSIRFCTPQVPLFMVIESDSVSSAAYDFLFVIPRHVELVDAFVYVGSMNDNNCWWQQLWGPSSNCHQAGYQDTPLSDLYSPCLDELVQDMVHHKVQMLLHWHAFGMPAHRASLKNPDSDVIKTFWRPGSSPRP